MSDEQGTIIYTVSSSDDIVHIDARTEMDALRAEVSLLRKRINLLLLLLEIQDIAGHHGLLRTLTVYHRDAERQELLEWRKESA